jgi:predicted ATP-dependent serine protease
MKNRLVDNLGIANIDSSMINLGSNFGVGKTTILTIIAAEFYHDGKNVLFLTDDTDEKVILKKAKKALGKWGPNLNACTFNVKKIHDLKSDLETQFKAIKYDLIVVDSIYIDYELLRQISFDNKCTIISSFQQVRKTITTDMVVKNINTLQFSDMVISLSIKKEFTFWQNLKYFVCFWLKKPNRNLKIIKNRYGKNESLDINVDFENVKIN